jgi:hypothetical protein
VSNILLYDIETTPNLAYVWGKWQQDVIAFESEWKLLSVAFKWLGKKKIDVWGTDMGPEQELVLLVHQLFDEADIVIAHNGDQFDQKMMNAKFIEYGLAPPSPYKTIDTKKVAKKYFRFTSNKLDDIGDLLGVGRKLQTGGFDLWLGCMQNDPKAWKKMKQYNKQDVVLLEKIYLKLRPWIDNHPSVAIIDNHLDGCPKCGSDKLQSRGYRYTKVAKYKRYQCMGCGGWCTGRRTEATNVEFVN